MNNHRFLLTQSESVILTRVLPKLTEQNCNPTQVEHGQCDSLNLPVRRGD